MDDIFYLSPAKLDTDCVCRVLQDTGGVCAENFKSSGAVQISTRTQMIHMTFMELSEFQTENQEFIQAHGIASIICISHHKSCVDETLELVKLLLNKWGGLVGNDNVGFLPVFNLTNVSEFSYT